MNENGDVESMNVVHIHAIIFKQKCYGPVIKVIKNFVDILCRFYFKLKIYTHIELI